MQVDGADISKVLIPSFFLEPRSLLEKYSVRCDGFDLFIPHLGIVRFVDHFFCTCRCTHSMHDSMLLHL